MARVMAELLKFRGRFAGKFLVYVTFDIDAYNRGEIAGNQPTVLYQGEPTDELLSAYKSWMHSVLSEIAQRINEKIVYLLPITLKPDRNTPAANAEPWVYYPDGKYERAKKPPPN